MDTSLHYTSVNHANCLVSTINNLRRGGKLCDIVISAGDVRIPAHRLVLAAASPYFGPLLELAHSSPSNGMPTEIRLHDIDAAAIEQIIEFCYTSTICVTEDNVWCLLPTATRLQMSELCTLCSDFLHSLLSPDTCMRTYAVAYHCGLTELVTEVVKMLKDSLDKVIQSDGFCEMSIEELSTALTTLPSAVVGHRDMVRAIRCWVQHDSETRKCHASQLAQAFPGLVSRLKEFLPEIPLFQPSDDSGTPEPDQKILRYEAGREDDGADSPAGDEHDGISSPPLCLVCGEIFRSEQELSQHKHDCTEALLKESGEVLENGFPDSPSDSLDGGEEDSSGIPSRRDQHVCQLCYKAFADKKSLGKHMRTHSQNGFSCSSCNKRYSTRSHLLGHMRLHSSTHSPFACDYCRHPFSSYCALKVHMRGHKGARPFSCPTCGQHFAKNIHLKRHISTHTGIKPHVCDLCAKHFSRSDHLKRHVQSIHAGQRPHACHICHKAFVRKYELNKHLQLHVRTGAMLSDATWDALPLLGQASPSPSMSLDSTDSP
ncbi:zinc finger and BTB domain-containing protein 49-like isoform X2 [Pomacea canaliculata]|uniref:zinc finger and BTB domain-containing protein 49-like isoform X2 n=1 Tax=Pomacea canaliculata TaxID=400727 RepID=UPI000D728AB8|nr:zinc finger and BTB domain-containing protein 49-like isoform X2 [Pomacea canaliculata]